MELQPFFATAPAGERRRAALLVTYSFPPDAHVGALRWQKMSANFAERGWALDVVTLDPADMPKQNAASLDDLPAGLRVYGVRHHQSGVQRLQRLALDARRRLLGRAAPASAPARVLASAAARPPAAAEQGAAEGTDPSLRTEDVLRAPLTPAAMKATYFAWVEAQWFERWARDATALALALTRERHYDAVITSGPPHVAHEVGYRVATKTGLPLVVDLRDPWSLRPRVSRELASAWALRRSARIERDVVEAASLIVANTEPLRDAMQAAHAERRDRVLAVLNGADDERLPRIERAPRFTLAFAGTIYLDRNPRVLFRALRRVTEELSLTPDDLALEMIGHVHVFGGVSTRAMAESEGVSPFVHLGPGVPRADALAFLARAHMLVTLPQDSPTQVPAKLFEYLNFPAWLLVHTPPGSAIARLLADTSADVVDVDDVDRTAAVIRQRFLEHRAGVQPRAVNADGRFSRSTQANRLIDALERLTDRPAPGGRGAEGQGAPAGSAV